MRVTGELIKKYVGDPELAAQYVGIARTLCGRMKAALGEATGARQWTLANGASIRTLTFPAGPDMVIIDVTKVTRPIEEPEVHGIVCIPCSDDAPDGWGPPVSLLNPIGRPGFRPNQFLLRANDKDRFEPKFKLKLHTDFETGNLDWVSLDRKRRLTFKGPRTRYFLKYGGGSDTSGTIWENGAVIEQGIATGSGSKSSLIGIAAVKDCVVAINHQIKGFPHGAASTYRFIYKFSGGVWTDGPEYVAPVRTNPEGFNPNFGSFQYVAFTMGFFNASATECTFVLKAPAIDLLSSDVEQLERMLTVTGSVSVDSENRMASIAFSEDIPKTLRIAGHTKTLATLGSNFIITSSEFSREDCGSIAFGVPGGTAVMGSGSGQDRSGQTETLGIYFGPGQERIVLCADYSGDTKILGEIEHKASATGVTGSFVSETTITVARSDYCDKGANNNFVVDIRGTANGGNSLGVFETYTLLANSAPIAVLHDDSLSTTFSDSASGSQHIIHSESATASNEDRVTTRRFVATTTSQLLTRSVIQPSFLQTKFPFGITFLDLRHKAAYLTRSVYIRTQNFVYDKTNDDPVVYTNDGTNVESMEEVFVKGGAERLISETLVSDSPPPPGSNVAFPFFVIAARGNSGIRITDTYQSYIEDGGISDPTFNEPAGVYSTIYSDYSLRMNLERFFYSNSIDPMPPVIETYGHSPVQETPDEDGLFFSTEVVTASTAQYFNYLYLDGAERDPVEIFGNTGANPRFKNIGSF